jgi:hypothetical protein
MVMLLHGQSFKVHSLYLPSYMITLCLKILLTILTASGDRGHQDISLQTMGHSSILSDMENRCSIGGSENWV